MKFVTIRACIYGLLIWFAFAFSFEVVYASLRENTLIDAAKHFIYKNDNYATSKPDELKAALGSRIFEDTRLSFNGKMSCATCHIDKFGSSDGLKNSIGVGGHGEGIERLNSDGVVVPRNSMALWGRGEPDFSVFFWDGKVEKTDDTINSQFGDMLPSDDPLTVAIHLPFVEIREMVIDDQIVDETLKNESISSAEAIYDTLVSRVQSDPDYVKEFESAYSLQAADIKFIHIADAIKNFIQSKFKLKTTKFENYVRTEQGLSETEIAGGLIFFGKGKCASCHSGRHFTDFKFYSVPFPQAGFGKNGFGVDYGRFNVTHNPDDLYKFRTPSLINVEKTDPYGHSGSTSNLKEAIIAHFDPLRLVDSNQMNPLERSELYKKILASNNGAKNIAYMDDPEIEKLVAFLKTLSYKEEE
ncbi:MAG: His-Xaa-Ser system-associated MauG-like protein [Alphaproteobacteria bacterium]